MWRPLVRAEPGSLNVEHQGTQLRQQDIRPDRGRLPALLFLIPAHKGIHLCRQGATVLQGNPTPFSSGRSQGTDLGREMNRRPCCSWRPCLPSALGRCTPAAVLPRVVASGPRRRTQSADAPQAPPPSRGTRGTPARPAPAAGHPARVHGNRRCPGTAEWVSTEPPFRPCCLGRDGRSGCGSIRPGPRSWSCPRDQGPCAPVASGW